jgi:hypothetical protein
LAHALIQPQLVEIVAEVVVMVHVVPRPAERISPHGVQQGPQLGGVVAIITVLRDRRGDLVRKGQEIAVDKLLPRCRVIAVVISLAKARKSPWTSISPRL